MSFYADFCEKIKIYCIKPIITVYSYDIMSSRLKSNTCFSKTLLLIEFNMKKEVKK